MSVRMHTARQAPDRREPGAPGAGPGARPRRGPHAGVVRHVGPAFLLPALLVVAVFFAWPQVLNVQYAFSSWTSYSSTIELSGWSNFAALVEQGFLYNAISVTIAYSVVTLLVQNVVSLGLAMTMLQDTRWNRFFRALFFLPVLLPPVAVGYIWRGMLAPDGPVNGAIGLVISGFDHAWLGDPATALVSVAAVDSWKWIGLTTLVYVAGLNSIPRELHEAAVMEGASGLQRFRSITLPLLAPALTFNVTLSFVGAFNAYDFIAAMTAGGPGDATRSLSLNLRVVWGQGFFGYGSALSLVVTVMVVLVAVPLIGWLRRREVHA